ncbi:MAG: glycosyltransferase [Candidatus Acidiferrales bacterium]
MTSNVATYVFLGLAAIPFIYYSVVLYSSWRFFRRSLTQNVFTPPVSILKPIRGLDPEAYENFASFCCQDYPEYELLFCVGQTDDPVIPIIEKLIRDFPERSIRILFSSGSTASNDKVAKLSRLVGEAQNEVLVMGDSDVRVPPDYLRTVVAPLANPKVGAVTCFYMPAHRQTLTENLQTIGMVSDFYAGILVGWQLDGVKFALGPTIATSRTRLAEFGGLQAIENQPGDDLLVGRLIAEHGHEVKLLPYTVLKFAGYHSFRELLDKRMRWMVVMRHMRPWGHFGLLLTQGLAWSLAAIAIHPSAGVALAYVGTYLGLRVAMTWSIGIRGLKQPGLWKELPSIPLWDAFALVIWVASFVRKTVRWRDGEYYIRDGLLLPVTSSSVEK